MRWAIGLVVTGMVVFTAFLVLAIGSSAPDPAMGAFPPSLLDQDVVMTQRMATDVGSGMQASMNAQGMLERSSNPVYVRALEEHLRLYERSLGLSS